MAFGTAKPVVAVVMACLWAVGAKAGAGAEAGADVSAPQGTDGLTPLDYSVANTGAVALSCDVALAHWYSDHLATIAPGAVAPFTLWSDPDTGTIYRMSAVGDRMPVQRLWCGADGNSWDSRYEVTLPRSLIADAARGEALTCAVQGNKTTCHSR